MLLLSLVSHLLPFPFSLSFFFIIISVQSCFLKNYDLDVEAPNDPRIFRVKDASRMAFGFSFLFSSFFLSFFFVFFFFFF